MRRAGAQCHLAVLLALFAVACAQSVQVPCATQTGNSGCVECLQKTCYYCNYLREAAWGSTGALNACKLTNTTCATAGPRDPYCARCSGTKCLRCKPKYGLNSLGKCANMTLGVCRLYSMNSECAACNQDGTCNRCGNAAKVLLPVNAIFLDAGYPETQCNTTLQAHQEALNITGAKAHIPANCSELDADFRCAACKPGYGPVWISATNKDIRCLPINTTTKRYVSGCVTNLPYMNYCTHCAGTGTKCTAGRCTGSRSVDGRGLCSLNCKGFFGIYCKNCTATACTALDPAWTARRRR